MASGYSALASLCIATKLAILHNNSSSNNNSDKSSTSFTANPVVDHCVVITDGNKATVECKYST